MFPLVFISPLSSLLNPCFISSCSPWVTSCKRRKVTLLKLTGFLHIALEMITGTLLLRQPGHCHEFSCRSSQEPVWNNRVIASMGGLTCLRAGSRIFAFLYCNRMPKRVNIEQWSYLVISIYFWEVSPDLCWQEFGDKCGEGGRISLGRLEKRNKT